MTLLSVPWIAPPGRTCSVNVQFNSMRSTRQTSIMNRKYSQTVVMIKINRTQYKPTCQSQTKKTDGFDAAWLLGEMRCRWRHHFVGTAGSNRTQPVKQSSET